MISLFVNVVVIIWYGSSIQLELFGVGSLKLVVMHWGTERFLAKPSGYGLSRVDMDGTVAGSPPKQDLKRTPT